MCTDLFSVNVNGTVSVAAFCCCCCCCWKRSCLDLDFVSIWIFDLLLIWCLLIIVDRWFKYNWLSINGYRLSSFDFDFDSVAQAKATVLAALYFCFGFWLRFWFFFYFGFSFRYRLIFYVDLSRFVSFSRHVPIAIAVHMLIIVIHTLVYGLYTHTYTYELSHS